MATSDLVAQLGQLVIIWTASWLFAFSAESQILWGYLVWVVLAANGIWGVMRCFSFKENEGWRRREVESGISPMTPITPYRRPDEEEESH